MPRIALLFAVLCFSLTLVSSTAMAQSEYQGKEITVGVYVSPPFVIMQNGVYGGMAIELWEAVGKTLGLQTRYVAFRNVDTMIQAAQGGDIDVVVTNFTVTHERAHLLEFSYPWFDSGLRILCPAEGQDSLFDELESSGSLYVYAAIFILIIALTTVLTLFRRRLDPEFTPRWSVGLASSFFDVISAAKSGSFNYSNLSWAGYLLAAMWMLFGVAIITYVMSTMSSALTALSLSSDISSIYDLAEKRAGVLSGSPAQTLLRDLGIEVITYPDVDDAVEALRKDDIHAIVADAPVLEYWDYQHPKMGLRVVGNIFSPDKYAFAANKKHEDLMDVVSITLIQLHEEGKIQKLRDKYLGRMNM